jgi:outer membrane protein assembly factor BamB
MTDELVLVTSYSGYAENPQAPGDLRSLSRHLIAVDRKTGVQRWRYDASSETAEDPFEGYLTEHGYASSTPTTDGQCVYAFFGKDGVHAVDLDGNRLWQTSVGTQSSNRRWGSAASLILYDDLVIVNASEEQRAIIALESQTGKVRWRAEGGILELAYGTPLIAKDAGGQDVLIVIAPGEIWGLNPNNGKLRWYASHSLTGNVCPSVLVRDQIVYGFGGFRSSGSFAMKLGGRGELSKDAFIWQSRASSYVATPLLHQDALMWLDDRGIAWCIRASDGKELYRQRVEGLQASGRPVYSSPVLAESHWLVPSRWDGIFAFGLGDSYQLLAQNRLPNDDSEFNATPAIDRGDLLLRSNKALYCLRNS